MLQLFFIMSLLSIRGNIFPSCLSSPYAIFFFLCSVVLLFNVCYVSCQPCQVSAHAGTFQGSYSPSQSVLSPAFPMCIYRGIRYGKPPLGNLRFGRSVLAAPLRGNAFDATTDGNICPQYNTDTNAIEGDEDCLFLNVFTPQLQTEDSPLPVMVYIPGTAFLSGSCNSEIYGGDHLVPKGVVLVVINHRINVLGFYNLEEEDCSGNMGLADQILALQWVQQNIQAFGGDSNCVTVFGQSSGGVSAYLLALSPQAKGLIHRVIVQSVMVTTDSYLVRDPAQVVNVSILVAHNAGYKGDPNDRKAILTYMRSLSVATVVEGYFSLIPTLIQNDHDGFYYSHGPPLFPCTDSYATDAIIPASLEELGRAALPIPCMIGYLDADGSMYMDVAKYLPYIHDIPTYTKGHLEAYLREVNPILVEDPQTLETVSQKVMERYYNSSNSDNEVDKTVKLLTFISYKNLYTLLHDTLSIAGRSIYVYNFRFASMLYGVALKVAMLGITNAFLIKGAVHGAEIPYLFYIKLMFLLPPSSDERRLTNEMCTLWTNFAKTGNPNNGPNITGVEWKANTPTQDWYLEINTETCLMHKKINQVDHDFFDVLEKFAASNMENWRKPSILIDVFHVKSFHE